MLVATRTSLAGLQQRLRSKAVGGVFFVDHPLFRVAPAPNQPLSKTHTRMHVTKNPLKKPKITQLLFSCVTDFLRHIQQRGGAQPDFRRHSSSSEPMCNPGAIHWTFNGSTVCFCLISAEQIVICRCSSAFKKFQAGYPQSL